MPIFKFWRPQASASGTRSAAGRAGRPIERRVQGGQRPAEPRSYEAVAIRPHGAACKFVRALAGKRFLVAEAPTLPLAGCTAHCRCTYRGHPDRRQEEPRRSADVGVSSRFYVGQERRSGLDRRRGQRAGGDDYFGFMRQRDV
jgi:hypothetical protein